jgi:hypothetical protein
VPECTILSWVISKCESELSQNRACISLRDVDVWYHQHNVVPRPKEGGGGRENPWSFRSLEGAVDHVSNLDTIRGLSVIQTSVDVDVEREEGLGLTPVSRLKRSGVRSAGQTLAVASV